MGAAYATGFASSGGTSADNQANEATPLFGTPAAANPSLYKNLVTGGSLGVTFDGNYAVIPSTVLFTVDLTQNDGYNHALPVGSKYYTDVVLNNWQDLGLDGANPAWDTLDLKFLAVECPSGTFANWTPTGNGPTNASAQMHVDRVDAHVTFTGMLVGHTYCIGLDTANASTEAHVLQLSSGGTVDGTVMFRPNASPTGTAPAAPQFTATVNRSS